MTFEQKMEKILERDDVHTREDMADMAISFIKDGDEYLAIHVLEAMKFNNAEYFHWDRTCGLQDSVAEIDEELADDLYEGRL